jgi:hypothetical protein
VDAARICYRDGAAGKSEKEYEGSGIGKENLHEVQSGASARRSAGHLHEREAPAASGLGRKLWLASQE